MEKSLEGRAGDAKEHTLVLKWMQDTESVPSAVLAPSSGALTAHLAVKTPLATLFLTEGAPSSLRSTHGRAPGAPVASAEGSGGWTSSQQTQPEDARAGEGVQSGTAQPGAHCGHSSTPGSSGSERGALCLVTKCHLSAAQDFTTKEAALQAPKTGSLLWCCREETGILPLLSLSFISFLVDLFLLVFL